MHKHFQMRDNAKASQGRRLQATVMWAADLVSFFKLPAPRCVLSISLPHTARTLQSLLWLAPFHNLWISTAVLHPNQTLLSCFMVPAKSCVVWVCAGSSPLSWALEKRATPLAGLSKGYDGILSPTVFSVITLTQNNACHILGCTSISRKVKDLRWWESYREVPPYALTLQGSRPKEGATSPWETHWAH